MKTENISSEDRFLIWLEEHLRKHKIGEMGDVLYHYTTSEALISIIQNRDLWLSQSDFLNDPQEMRYGIKLLQEVIKEYPIKDEFEKKILYNSLEVINRLRTQRKYVLSLSMDKDSLMLWSHYSKTDGYAIGFKLNNLIDRLYIDQDKNPFVLHYGKVLYKKEEQIDDINSFISPIFNYFRDFHDSSKQYLSYSLSEDIGDILSFKSLLYKAHYFHPEQEYRFVLVQQNDSHHIPNVGFRSARGTIIPYAKFQLGSQEDLSKTIHNIRIGPGNHNENTNLGVRELLNDNGLERVSVEKSEFRLQ